MKSKSVRIRMYRQGLGDCFLLSFPRSRRGESHVLIDCGVLTGTAGGTEKMTRVATSILDRTRRRLDVLVVTHEHWDHVSGFSQAEEIFDKLAIQEIWLGWTEDRNDALANDLAHRRGKALRAIELAAQRLNAASDESSRLSARRLTSLLEFQGGFAAASKMTAKAMDWVKNRRKARFRYMQPTDAPAGVPGTKAARVFALGPPRDRMLLKRMNPSAKHSEVYDIADAGGSHMGFLAAAETLESVAPPDHQPFEEWFRVQDEAAAEEAHLRRYFQPSEKWRQIESDWLDAAERLALQIDSYTNNTCLALAFELRPSGRVLLFPGDAQVGNWLSWEGLEWKVREERAKTSRVTAADLLARTVLYKVGHHGSHNATLREKGLELMTSDELTAMIPVCREMAQRQEWNMPFPSLHRRLAEKTKGRILEADKAFALREPPGAGRDWRRFVSRVTVDDDFIEYTVDR